MFIFNILMAIIFIIIYAFVFNRYIICTALNIISDLKITAPFFVITILNIVTAAPEIIRDITPANTYVMGTFFVYHTELIWSFGLFIPIIVLINNTNDHVPKQVVNQILFFTSLVYTCLYLFCIIPQTFNLFSLIVLISIYVCFNVYYTKDGMNEDGVSNEDHYLADYRIIKIIDRIFFKNIDEMNLFKYILSMTYSYCFLVVYFWFYKWSFPPIPVFFVLYFYAFLLCIMIGTYFYSNRLLVDITCIIITFSFLIITQGLMDMYMNKILEEIPYVKHILSIFYITSVYLLNEFIISIRFTLKGYFNYAILSLLSGPLCSSLLALMYGKMYEMYKEKKFVIDIHVNYKYVTIEYLEGMLFFLIFYYENNIRLTFTRKIFGIRLLIFTISVGILKLIFRRIIVKN